MAEKRLIDANELEEKAIYITGPKGSACHAVPLGLIQAAPTIDPETLRPTAHIIRGYVGFALLGGGLVVLTIEIVEWFGRKEDKRLERLKDEKRQPKT